MINKVIHLSRQISTCRDYQKVLRHITETYNGLSEEGKSLLLTEEIREADLKAELIEACVRVADEDRYEEDCAPEGKKVIRLY